MLEFLFDLFINDITYKLIAQYFLNNYTDNKKLYSIGKNLEQAKMDHQKDFRAIIFCFFSEDYMILNSEKSHCLWIGKNCADDTFIRNGKKFKNSKEETNSGVIIDNKLTFDSYIKRMCKKSDQKHFQEYQLY